MNRTNIRLSQRDMVLDADPYKNLANAIIIQATEDYRSAYKRHIRCYRCCDKINLELEELERFFRSEWYRTLTSVDGEYLMKRIREEVCA